jgi:predicted GIY-YIG superfamily endonuclease
MNRTLFLLAAGYVGGMYIASRYGSGKGGRATASFQDFADEFVKVHRAAFTEVESSELGRDVKAKLRTLKTTLSDEASGFAREAEELVTRLTHDGKTAAKDIEAELKNLYARRKEIISDLQDKGVEQISDARNAVRDLAQDALDSLEAQYEKIRKTIKTNA